MKKLLIATTALVATAGMANADITITGHAAAGIHSGLDATAAADAVVGAITAAEVVTLDAMASTNTSAADTAIIYY